MQMILVTRSSEKYINWTTNNEAKGEKGKPLSVYIGPLLGPDKIKSL